MRRRVVCIFTCAMRVCMASSIVKSGLLTAIRRLAVMRGTCRVRAEVKVRGRVRR